jgi:RimJ/RimL family protein N-acetyltransferase
VNAPHAPKAALFVGDGWRAVELNAADVPVLQAFFDANPEYFRAVNGVPPRPDEAQREFDDRPPAQMPFERQWMIGCFDDAGRMIAMAGLLSNFLADRVWHIGLFIVATSLHGSGLAPPMIERLHRWMADRGARWVRLGVVLGNRRAERFWEKLGYAELRRRTGVQTGDRVSTIRVMVKALGHEGFDAYLRWVERDRPDSTLQ